MRGSTRIRLLSLLTAVAAVSPATAVAAPGEGLRAMLDRAFHQAAAEFGPAGVQAVAIRDGRVLWSNLRGAAVLAPRQEVNARTTFAYASLSKLVLAAFALRQVEKRALELDRPISAYVGDEVAGSKAVTVRMLLQHTAGYPDLYADPATAPLFPPGEKYDPNRPYTFAMLNAGIREPVNPGAKFEYSNTGYLVLGRVLVKAAGGEQAFRRVFADYLRGASAGLATAERSPREELRLAHGHLRQPDGSLRDYHTAYGARGIPTDLYGLPFTDGLLAGTATGAGLVLDALFTRGRLLAPETVRQMVTPSPQSGGAYGMGTSPRTVGGRVWQGHAGSYGGFTSMAATDRGTGTTLAVVVNQAGPRLPGPVIWQALAETFSR